jgi:penicillin-binding protein 1B
VGRKRRGRLSVDERQPQAAFSNQMRRPLVYAALGVLLLGIVYLAYLDFKVARQFERRRWSEPARVYAEPLELYEGLAISGDALEQELKRLRYRRVSKLTAPGTYRRNGAQIDISARAVRFADEAQKAQAVRVTLDRQGVADLRDARGKPLPSFRLDPLLIGSIFAEHGEDRIVIAPGDIPALLPKALKVVEDRNFDRHAGLDGRAIARALVTNVRAGEIEQGGSTITQQLVKSYFLDNRRTLTRKAREAVMALMLEAHFDKPDIMTAYINEVYLAQDGSRAIHGFGLASQFYFGKSLQELDLSQIALLVAVVRGPSYYDPRRQPARARQRRDLVLKLMSDFKVVSSDQARRAMARPLGVTTDVVPKPGYYPAFMDLVRRTLRRDYREEDITEAGLKIFTTFDPRVQTLAERALTEELTRLDRARRAKDKKATPLEGVVVVTSSQSGEVIALIGGRKTTLAGFNRALDAKRPIGSLAKPVVFLTALETGRYHEASIIEDEPVEVPLKDGKIWRPQNITHESYGRVPMVRALAESMNLATVRLGMRIGPPKVARKLEDLGLASRPNAVPAMLLGSVDASPLEVAQMFSSLANGGFRTPLRAVRAVVDAQGKPLKSFALEATPVAKPDAVYQVNRMMVEAINRGTGRPARASLPAKLVVAGKTGTSSDYRDSWFAGFSGRHLAVVWIGSDDNRPTGLTGASGALPVWSKVMGGIRTSSWQAPLPASLDELWIDYPTGYAADPKCSDDVVVVAIPRGTELLVKPGCGSLFQDLATRAREWLRGIIRERTSGE